MVKSCGTMPIYLSVPTYFHVQVIKKDHNYAPPSSQETIQLLQEMGMKYRERDVTTFKSVKKT